MARGYIVHICGTREYRPGDPAPVAYAEWHAWAAVQHRAGLRQRRCGDCGLWRYPQELTGRERVAHPVRGDGVAVAVRSPICKKCAAGGD